MVQPLPKADEISSGIDAAVSRLEQAFLRLEEAVANTCTGHHSLKEDSEKLNHLLHEADGEIGRLKAAVKTVSGRLEKTLTKLEKQQA